MRKKKIKKIKITVNGKRQIDHKFKIISVNLIYIDKLKLPIKKVAIELNQRNNVNKKRIK